MASVNEHASTPLPPTDEHESKKYRNIGEYFIIKIFDERHTRNTDTIANSVLNTFGINWFVVHGILSPEQYHKQRYNTDDRSSR